ncbi:hypothetical protein V474_17630 [Novosphingobium barchaimii LL02]|uniref:Lipoprotein n=1 Tax=Novosphingobium barchaimii LL02 TaxID=1114963 RepID=A0A0J7XTA1_9SPHN|nr:MULTISPECIES: hypothetical protein [Novosphingobium]AXB77402.1 hypothetical protein TQ38_013585 [Novosphingobium sp. P6W]KIS33775.1 hypothetical protein TQ38_03505 [Novosphingobium sp. P6W]KMS54892.1 hypothetical protein V474_17630 [Novosphingobium barchaimii LL02]
MNIKVAALALAASSLSLGACATDGYGGYGGVQMGYGSPYAYDGWYDGHYGSIYDGYWGGDDYFYYRSNERDRRYRRADRNHFMRQAPQGQHNYRQQHGEFRPQQGMHMPQWRGDGAGRGGRGGGDHRGPDRRGRR